MPQPIRAKKSLGQNFLIDNEALFDISHSIQVRGKHIIEVGPGYGALTEYLVKENPVSLDLVELDQDMIDILMERRVDEWRSANLTIHHQDVLTLRPAYSEYSIIANIPYYITSPILFHFLYPEYRKGMSGGESKNRESEGGKLSEADKSIYPEESIEFFPLSGAFGTFQSGKVHSFHPPQEMVIMMQQEVGEKILEGRARKPHHSYLSLAMELACEDIEIVRYVRKESFDPAPKIDSIVLKFIVRKTRDHEQEEKLLTLWRTAFTHPRKTLLSNLKGSHYNLEEVKKWLIECGYDSSVRAEAVKKKDWGKLTMIKVPSTIEGKIILM